MKGKKDYYAILGCEKGASESQLKKAYRKLALALHPDKNSADGANEAFKAVGNAYAVLSNDEKRSRFVHVIYLHVESWWFVTSRICYIYMYIYIWI